MKIRTMKQ